jgi:hypothetical protein
MLKNPWTSIADADPRSEPMILNSVAASLPSGLHGNTLETAFRTAQTSNRPLLQHPAQACPTPVSHSLTLFMFASVLLSASRDRNVSEPCQGNFGNFFHSPAPVILDIGSHLLRASQIRCAVA